MDGNQEGEYSSGHYNSYYCNRGWIFFRIGGQLFNSQYYEIIEMKRDLSTFCNPISYIRKESPKGQHFDSGSSTKISNLLKGGLKKEFGTMYANVVLMRSCTKLLKYLRSNSRFGQFG